jgi:hypothetical protein
MNEQLRQYIPEKDKGKAQISFLAAYVAELFTYRIIMVIVIVVRKKEKGKKAIRIIHLAGEHHRIQPSREHRRSRSFIRSMARNPRCTPELEAEERVVAGSNLTGLNLIGRVKGRRLVQIEGQGRAGGGRIVGCGVFA